MKVLSRITRFLPVRSNQDYPLRPARKVRRGVEQFRIDDRVCVEVFWKAIEFGTGPALSLFVDQYEVLRFDCSGPGTGHYHIANQSKFCRIWMCEQQIEAQIERAVFEVEKNLGFYIDQNPIVGLRGVVPDPGGVTEACVKARLKLLEYADMMRNEGIVESG